MKLFALMVLMTVAILRFAARAPSAVKAPPPQALRDESPWLSREATKQLFGAAGAPGPLFASLTVGGAAPNATERERVDAFARDNGVDITLDTHDDTLTAIRVVVTFGGCCGYQGADTLAMHLGRRSSGVCCVCGPDTWIDDWALVNEGVHMRVAVRINRVEVTWRRALTTSELFAEAESLVGRSIHSLRDRPGFHERVRDDGYQPSRDLLLELPLPYSSWAETPVKLVERDDLGVRLEATLGIVTSVHLSAVTLSRDDPDVRTAAAARWGRPRVHDGALTWIHGGRHIEVCCADELSTLTITQ